MVLGGGKTHEEQARVCKVLSVWEHSGNMGTLQKEINMKKRSSQEHDDTKCSYIRRVMVPNNVPGGAGLGRCEKDCIPGFTVCFDHVTKEALYMMIQSLRNKQGGAE